MSADKSNRSGTESACSSNSISSDHENLCAIPPNNAQCDNDYHQYPAAKKPDVFERNYQFARIYENKRRALTAKLEANQSAQCGFKAQPVRIEEFRLEKKLPNFTIPTTPKVMKHNLGKRTAKK